MAQLTASEISSIREAGRKAAAAKKKIEDNPHGVKTDAWGYWREGFKSATRADGEVLMDAVSILRGKVEVAASKKTDAVKETKYAQYWSDVGQWWWQPDGGGKKRGPFNSSNEAKASAKGAGYEPYA